MRATGRKVRQPAGASSGGERARRDRERREERTDGESARTHSCHSPSEVFPHVPFRGRECPPPPQPRRPRRVQTSRLSAPRASSRCRAGTEKEGRGRAREGLLRDRTGARGWTSRTPPRPSETLSRTNEHADGVWRGRRRPPDSARSRTRHLSVEFQRLVQVVVLQPDGTVPAQPDPGSAEKPGHYRAGASALWRGLRRTSYCRPSSRRPDPKPCGLQTGGQGGTPSTGRRIQ